MNKVFSLIALTALVAGCGTAHKAVQTDDDDIVNIGYGTQLRKNVSSHVTSSKPNEKQTFSDIYAYLRTIPAINSISAQGGGAIVIVNGLRTTWAGLQTINPQDVESVDVISDATSNIYGMESSRVILIKTKGSI